jgi:hypothetical protein
MKPTPLSKETALSIKGFLLYESRNLGVPWRVPKTSHSPAHWNCYICHWLYQDSEGVEGDPLHLSVWKTSRSLPNGNSGSCYCSAVIYATAKSAHRFWFHSRTMDSFCHVVTRKNEGLPYLTRLRDIHLFKADYYLFLKIIFGKRMVKCRKNQRHWKISSMAHGHAVCPRMFGFGTLGERSDSSEKGK